MRRKVYLLNPSGALMVNRIRGKLLGFKTATSRGWTKDLSIPEGLELLEILRELRASGGKPARPWDPQILRLLIETGLLIEKESLPPPTRFGCSAHEALGEVPPIQVETVELKLNPHIEMRAPRLPEGLSNPKGAIWIRDPLLQVWTPLWPDKALLRSIRDLKKRESLQGLSPATTRALLQCRVLVPRQSLSRAGRSRIIQELARRFRAQGFVVIPDLLPPNLAGELRQYYRAKISNGEMTLGDTQVATRYFQYGEPVARYFHRQYSKFVSEVVGEALKPAISYLISYQAGSELQKHRDRDECRIVVSS
ncbi:MAG: hypothetical protein ACXWPM_07790, partial [Bdellovibrionota bacterium]